MESWCSRLFRMTWILQQHSSVFFKKVARQLMTSTITILFSFTQWTNLIFDMLKVQFRLVLAWAKLCGFDSRCCLNGFNYWIGLLKGIETSADNIYVCTIVFVTSFECNIVKLGSTLKICKIILQKLFKLTNFIYLFNKKWINIYLSEVFQADMMKPVFMSDVLIFMRKI